jgi:hypothetical protein
VRVAVQLLACSDRCAGCMTRGRVGSRRSAPTWRGCIPPAWLPAPFTRWSGRKWRDTCNRWTVACTVRGGLASSALGQLARLVGPSPRAVGGGPWSVLGKTQPMTAGDASRESRF